MDNIIPVAVDTLSLFSPRPVQTAMEGYQILTIEPSNENISTASTIEFDFPCTENSVYYELGSTQLFLEFETKSPDGATKISGLATTDGNYVDGTFINMPTSSFFSDVHFTIYDKACESTGNMYPYQAMIHDILMYDKKFRREILRQSGYIDEMCKDDTTTAHPDASTNDAYTSRITKFKIADSERFVGRINLGMFKQPLKVPAFLKMKLTFTKASLPFVAFNPALGATDAPTIRFVIKKIYLNVHAVDVTKAIYQAHLDGLKTQNLTYNFTCELVVTETVAKDAHSKNWSQVFPSSQLPKLIVMTMVRSDAFTGSPKYNPFNFQHFGANYIQLKVNAKPVPFTDAFRPPAWEKNKFLHEYKTLDLIGTGEHGITPIQYVNGHFLWYGTYVQI